MAFVSNLANAIANSTSDSRGLLLPLSVGWVAPMDQAPFVESPKFKVGIIA
jgi:hypothetical protein